MDLDQPPLVEELRQLAVRPATKNGDLREGYRGEDGFWREWRMVETTRRCAVRPTVTKRYWG